MPDLAERPLHDPSLPSARPDPTDSGTEPAQTTAHRPSWKELTGSPSGPHAPAQLRRCELPLYQAHLSADRRTSWRSMKQQGQVTTGPRVPRLAGVALVLDASPLEGPAPSCPSIP